MGKNWDYEDDHDWDDNVDYAAMGYVYWYGKYYPKEYVDSLYPPEVDWKKLGVVGLFSAVGLIATWGAVKVMPPAKRWVVSTASPKMMQALSAAKVRLVNRAVRRGAAKPDAEDADEPQASPQA